MEGAETEPRVYEAWLRHRLPALHRVPNVADLIADGYVPERQGLSLVLSQDAALLRDIEANPGRVQEF